MLSKDGWRMLVWLLVLSFVFWSAYIFRSCDSASGPTTLEPGQEQDNGEPVGPTAARSPAKGSAKRPVARPLQEERLAPFYTDGLSVPRGNRGSRG
jgi:hypothetical protein